MVTDLTLPGDGMPAGGGKEVTMGERSERETTSHRIGSVKEVSSTSTKKEEKGQGSVMGSGPGPGNGTPKDRGSEQHGGSTGAGAAQTMSQRAATAVPAHRPDGGDRKGEDDGHNDSTAGVLSHVLADSLGLVQV